MAVVQNTYTGNGSTVLYSLSFSYLDQTDVKVSVNGTIVTNYIFATASSIQFLTAPGAGTAIRIYRETDIDQASATIFPGSAIKAQDLNDNFTQTLYAVQESNFEADSATTTANTALTTANTAISTANAATSTANTALSNSATAVSTANTASTNASNAVTTANTASSNASAAVTTANAATVTANSAASTAATALSTANTASSNASAAVSTANTASTNASNAVTTANTALSTANTASSNASTAVTTANNAVSTANGAVSTANTALTTANAAISAVASAVIYTPVANLTALAALTPSNGDYFELTDSTGAEGSALITGVTVGLVGAPGLTFRLRYDAPPGIFTFLGYFANDSETRYLKFSGGTLTGQLRGDDSTSASTPGFAFDGDANTGIGRPGADELALITGGTARLTIDPAGAVSIPGTLGVTGAITGSLTGSASNNVLKAGDTMTGALVHPLGAAATPSITFTGDLNTGIYSPGADQVAVATNGTGRLFVNSSGSVGIGTSSPAAALHVSAQDGTIYQQATRGTGTTWRTQTSGANGQSYELYDLTNSQRAFIYQGATGTEPGWTFNTAGTARIRIDNSGRVGIGTTTVNSLLEVRGTTDGQNVLHLSNSAGTSDGSAENQIRVTCNGNSAWANLDIQAYQTIFTQNGGEKARIDPNGRLLVGTSTARANTFNGGISQVFQIEGIGDTNRGAGIFSSVAGESGAYLVLGHQRSGAVGGNTAIASGDDLGLVSFQGSDGTEFVEGARIAAVADGGVSANDMPTRLVFSTTADGASSPTERMRIDRDGNVMIAKTALTIGTAGIQLETPGAVIATRVGEASYVANRLTNDGNLFNFYQDSTLEGSISVSGTTVSYNGAHLSRWSQLPSGQEREEILRGSVLSNLDEMCEWGEEHNEQLNRMKVSDVEGDKNVSGVFQAWDDDDDTYTNDFYCAMTGDFIIRIAEGVTVERGDLLMSAGDGTAKPQDDDIIRSKTIAKVTSTNVSCTYDDGSYCVPCVLMAC